MSRPKVFAVSLEPPRMPGSGGEVRTYFFIRMLAQWADLTLVSLGGPAGDRKVSQDIAGICAKVIQPQASWRNDHRPLKPGSRLRSWTRSLGVMLMPWRDDWREFYRYCMQYLQSESVDTSELSLGKRFLCWTLRTHVRIGAKLRLMPSRGVFAYADQFESIRYEAVEALAGEQFDVAWYEHTVSYPFLEALMDSVTSGPRPQLVCNAHNIEWRLHDRIGTTAADAWQAEFNALQAQLLNSLERRQFRDCDLVFTCSENDAALGRQMASETKFIVIGNGVDTEYFRPPCREPHASKPTLLFTGTFGYGPNRDGLKYFIEDVFPLIRQRMPMTEFVFAGYQAKQAQQELGIDDDQIRCVSDPPDMRPCFHEAWVFVVPLRAGSGTRLKILEAMSMHCPVVSTKLGAEGIGGDNGTHFLLADSAQEFADQTVRLLQDRDLRQRLQCASSTWVRQHYDWNQLCDRAAMHLKALLSRAD